MTDQLTCVQASLDVGESAFGTGNKHGIFIVIEWNRAWPAKAVSAFVEAELPGEKAKCWEGILGTLPDPQVQLIRRPNTRQESDGLISVYVAVPDELRPYMYAFDFKTYDDILQIDFDAILKKSEKYKDNELKKPVFLVCTHGRREICCAKQGLPLYNEMVEFAGEYVWQTSHIGGHRFAATMICLPHGIYYGRVGVPQAAEIVKSYRQGRMLHQFYRGRACYGKREQAAEYFLRKKTSRDSLNSFRLDKQDVLSDLSTQFVFTAIADRHLHHVQVEQTESAWKIPASTGDSELQSFPVYRLVSYRMSQSEEHD